VHVLDRVDSGPKPALVKELGATYHTGSIADVGLRPDIVLECTGVVGLVQQSIASVSPGGIVCLTGVGPAGAAAGSAAALATEAVLKNLVVVGSVNANRRHYYRAAKALAAADRGWLAQLITRRVGLEQVQSGLQRAPEDIKVIVEMTRS
jgi:glucose 1-dehydrogenase